MKKIQATLLIVFIALISLAMHFQHLSKDLVGIHVWRQTQTQSTINSFYQEDFNILNPRRNERREGDGIFRMEFPLMQWCVAGIYKVVGYNLIITRIFMFIIGLFSIAGIYALISAIFNNNLMAAFGAWAFSFSPSFYFYTINPLPDILALCCSIWGIAFFFSWIRKKATTLLVISGFFLSLGALCKLPFILYFIVPSIYFVFSVIKNKMNKKDITSAFLLFSFIIFPTAWYGFVIRKWYSTGIVSGITDNKESAATLFDYLKHNLISTLPELLINYGSLLFFLLGFYFMFKNKMHQKSLFPIFIGWSLAVTLYFLFELNMIAKIHDYYLFPFYPLIFIIVSYGAYNLYVAKYSYAKYVVISLLMILPVTAYLRMHKRWDTNSPGFNKDLFIYKDELRKIIPSDALCIVGNDESHFIYFYYIDKKGWGIQNDEIGAEAMKEMIDKGASYLYSDSRKIDQNPQVIPFLGKQVLEKGSIKVFQLKKN